jgi:hypothetical protein
MRKTIEVSRVRDIANAMLKNSDADVSEARIGVYMLLESILMATDNYHGYGHIDGNQGNTDPTRRVYR